MSDPSFLSLERLTLAYGKSVAVPELSLAIGQGELVALLGPSGCGKTTTMRAIAGLLPVASGRITLAGSDITHLAANRRQVGLVFQSYALFPHLSAFENVAFGLRLRGDRGAGLTHAVEGALASVGLSALAHRKPSELSGGQQQRVALARAVVMAPKVLLLDEPLSNLDARLRLDMRAELKRMHRETGLTMMVVTHDQAEALALADRIVVMNGGRIEQIGAPEEIYHHPRSRFVAQFLGFENLFEVKDGALVNEHDAFRPAESLPPALGFAWRPSAVELGTGQHKGTVLLASFSGATRDYVLDTPLGRISAQTDAAAPAYAAGEAVSFALPLAKAVALQVW